MTQIKWLFSHNNTCLWGLDSFGQLMVRNTIPKIIMFFNGWLNLQIWWIVNYFNCFKNLCLKNLSEELKIDFFVSL